MIHNLLTLFYSCVQLIEPALPVEHLMFVSIESPWRGSRLFGAVY
jgi:hypothetical protein